MIDYKEIQEFLATDALGKVVKVGDILAYTVRKGSYHNIHFGRVYNITTKEWEYDNGTRLRRTRAYIVTMAKIFQHSSFQQDLRGKFRLFLDESLRRGVIPESWNSCYVSYPKKTCIRLKCAIIIDPKDLPETVRQVIVGEEWVITQLKCK